LVLDDNEPVPSENPNIEDNIPELEIPEIKPSLVDKKPFNSDSLEIVIRTKSNMKKSSKPISFDSPLQDLEIVRQKEVKKVQRMM